MDTRTAGFRRMQGATVALGIGAIAVVGTTSALAYADTHHSTTGSSVTTTGSDGSAEYGESSSDDSGGSFQGWNSQAPAVSPGFGSSHAQSSGS